MNKFEFIDFINQVKTFYPKINLPDGMLSVWRKKFEGCTFQASMTALGLYAEGSSKPPVPNELIAEARRLTPSVVSEVRPENRPRIVESDIDFLERVLGEPYVRNLSKEFFNTKNPLASCYDPVINAKWRSLKKELLEQASKQLER